MYDAIDDPYTCENSTVLVNKLDLRDQDELEVAGYGRDLMRRGPAPASRRRPLSDTMSRDDTLSESEDMEGSEWAT